MGFSPAKMKHLIKMGLAAVPLVRGLKLDPAVLQGSPNTIAITTVNQYVLPLLQKAILLVPHMWSVSVTLHLCVGGERSIVWLAGVWNRKNKRRLFTGTAQGNCDGNNCAETWLLKSGGHWWCLDGRAARPSWHSGKYRPCRRFSFSYLDLGYIDWKSRRCVWRSFPTACVR